jgi:hypothetical protein
VRTIGEHGRVEAIRTAGQGSAGSGLQVKSEPGGMIFHLAPMGRFVDCRVQRVLEKDGIELEFGGVVQELEVVPPHGSEAVGVEANRKSVHRGDRSTSANLQ